MIYQQGDVLIEKVEEIKGKKLNHLVLARGEVTGHCHEITAGEAELYEEEGILYLRVKGEEATLTHQEHKTIKIPKGDYKIRKVREYDHLAADEVSLERPGIREGIRDYPESRIRDVRD